LEANTAVDSDLIV